MIKGKAQVDDQVSDRCASKQVELECESSDEGRTVMIHEQLVVQVVLDSDTKSDAPQEKLYNIARDRLEGDSTSSKIWLC